MGNASPSSSQQNSGDEANDLTGIDTPTDLHQAVKEYLKVECDDDKLSTISSMLESWKNSEDVLKIQKENLFEIVCRMKSLKHANMNIKIDRLLDVFIKQGIDLNDRNRNGETFLMLACKHKRIDIVRSLLKLNSRDFLLDIDAVDNSGETALTKARQNEYSKIVAALLILKVADAIEDKKEDIVIFILNEIRNMPQNSWKAQETQLKIWREIIYIAMENDTKHSEEILKHLLDYDTILSLEGKIGDPILHRLIGSEKKVHDKKLRLIEMLLRSEKITANARDMDGKTALHCVKEEKVTSLLIGLGADVNKKDKNGRTALMSASWSYGGKTDNSVMQTMVKEEDSLLDASDCNGRTALTNAVMMRFPDIVEFFLSAGASVNLSDNLGFTALHHALRGESRNHVEFPRNSNELKKIKDMSIIFDAEKPQELSKRCDWYTRNKEWNAERTKIVEMLLQRPDIDVNALSFEKFSPLDIAEGCIPETPSSIINSLKEKGAVLNVFRQTQLQLTCEFHLDVRWKVTLKWIALLVILSKNKKELDFLTERLLTLIRTYKDKIVAGKDQQGRTALHLTTIICYKFAVIYEDSICDLANTIVKELISIGCCVNETDIFGRTPLHYTNKILKDFLISFGADTSIKDKDGKSVNDQTSESDGPNNVFNIVKAVCDQSDETYSLRLMNNTHKEIYTHDADPQVRASDDSNLEFWRKELNLKSSARLLWEEGKYAFLHPLVDKVTKEVIDFIEAIVKEIERMDPRFAIRPELVGSSNEGTRLGKPDEFDFCFVLTKISELCEVFQSPELPTGFVHLKRRPKKVGETSDFESFFGKDEILNSEKLNWQFTAILQNALVNIENQLSSAWNLTFQFQSIFRNLEKVLNIVMSKPLNFICVNEISIDIVPCIYIDGWWPDEAISNVSDDIKKFGCNLVFDGPQKLYPWVPFSESCARISFSKCESDMLKESCDSAREAYMIGKMMVDSIFGLSKYTLKNCLLYCIEALSPSSEKASELGLSLEELEFKFHLMDRYLWLNCALKCHLEFVSQNFCPCYFLPNSSSPIGKEHLKKSSLDWIFDGDSSFPKLCKNALALYRSTSNDTSKSSYQLPAPDPLWERFDRKQLIASLCEIAYK